MTPWLQRSLLAGALGGASATVCACHPHTAVVDDAAVLAAGDAPADGAAATASRGAREPPVSAALASTPTQPVPQVAPLPRARRHKDDAPFRGNAGPVRGYVAARRDPPAGLRPRWPDERVAPVPAATLRAPSALGSLWLALTDGAFVVAGDVDAHVSGRSARQGTHRSRFRAARAPADRIHESHRQCGG